jgi:predicted nucleic acid-binding protein
MVVDASIAVQWFSNEPGSENAARLIEEPWLLAAPDIMPVEAANAWWKKVRRGEMLASDVEHAIVNLLAVGVAWTPCLSLLERAAPQAIRTALPVYDCLYLVLAADRGATLATADAQLRQAATRLNIPVWRS